MKPGTQLKLRHERFKIVQSRHRVDSVARGNHLESIQRLKGMTGCFCEDFRDVSRLPLSATTGDTRTVGDTPKVLRGVFLLYLELRRVIADPVIVYDERRVISLLSMLGSDYQTSLPGVPAHPDPLDVFPGVYRGCAPGDRRHSKSPSSHGKPGPDVWSTAYILESDHSEKLG